MKNVEYKSFRNTVPDTNYEFFGIQFPIDRNWANSKRRILFVLEHVDSEDLRTKRLLTGPSGTWIPSLVKLASNIHTPGNAAYGVINYNFLKTFVLSGSERAGAEQIQAQRIRDAIAKLKPTDVIILGDTAAQYVMPNSVDRYFLLKRRGQPVKHNNIYYTNTLCLSRSYERYKKDASEADEEEAMGIGDLLDYASIHVANAFNREVVYKINVKPKHILVDTIAKVDKLFNLLDKKDAIAVDTETVDLTRVSSTILTIQFAFDVTKGYVIPIYHRDSPFNEKEIDYIRKKVRAFLGQRIGLHDISRYLLGQNLKFDLTVLRQFTQLYNINWPIYDLMAGEFVLNENLKGLSRFPRPDPCAKFKPFALDTICSFYGCNIYDEGDFSKEDRVTISNQSLSAPGLLDYCALDVQIPFAIRDKQMQRATDVIVKGEPYIEQFKKLMLAQMSNIIQIESIMEHRGDLLDLNYLLKLKSANGPIAKTVNELQATLFESPAVQRLNKKLLKESGVSSKTIFGKQTQIFSISKPEHKQRLFIDELRLAPITIGKSGAPSIDKEFQAAYKDVPEVVTFNHLSSVSVIRNTYVNGWYEKLLTDADMRKDYRLRPSFGFTGTVTGRSNSFQPNLMNIPNRGPFAKYIKRMSVASRGHLILKLDYCVAGDSYIPTKKGLVQLSTLADKTGKPVDINLVTSSIDRKGSIAQAVYKGKKPVLELVTLHGNKVKVTPDHRMLVLREGSLTWVEAQDCNKQDLICISNVECTRDKLLPLNLSPVNSIQLNNTSGHTNVYQYTRTKYRVKIKIPNKRRKYHTEKGFTLEEAIAYRNDYCKTHSLAINRSFTEIKKPEYMTPDLAWLLGTLVSEGWMYKDHLFFGNTNLKFLKRYKKLIKSVFGVDCKLDLKRQAGSSIVYKGVIYNANRDQYQIRIRSTQLVTWLRELGIYWSDKTGKIQPSKLKTVPECIMQADKESQLAFLSAYLEGDGSIGYNSLSYASTSRRLLSQIQILLNSHGVKSSIKSLEKNTGAVFVGTEGTTILWPLLKPYALSKLLKGKPVGTPRLGRVPTEMWDNMTLTQRRAYKKANCIVSPLVSKRKAGTTDVYDLTMKDRTRPVFVANGFLVHNCAHEVRIWGIISGDEELCKLFVTGRWLRKKFRETEDARFKQLMDTYGDIHKLNCVYFFGADINNIAKEMRDSVKSVVFGAIYGRSPGSIAKQANTTVDVIKDTLKRFFNRFKKASQWLQDNRSQAVKKGYVISPLGRMRHMSTQHYGLDAFNASVERRGCNSPIQGMAADIGQTSAILYVKHLEHVVRKFKLDDDLVLSSGVNNFVHDAIKTEAKYEYFLVCLRIFQWCSTTGVMDYYRRMFGVKFFVELEVEFEIAAHDANHIKWDWSENGPLNDGSGGIKEVIRAALNDQKEIYPDIDVKEIEKKIWAITKNKKLMAYLDEKYPIFHDYCDAHHVVAGSKDERDLMQLLKTVKE